MAAGCKTAENSLRREDVASLKLTGVAVRYKPDASIMWEDAVRAYATASNIVDDKLAEASTSPQAKAYMQKYLADRNKSTPNKADTRFRIGSINKMFTAIAVLQLAQAGKLTLNGPIGKYIND